MLGIDYDETETLKTLKVEKVEVNPARTSCALTITNIDSNVGGGLGSTLYANFTFLRYNIVLIGSDFSGFGGSTVESSYIYGKISELTAVDSSKRIMQFDF